MLPRRGKDIKVGDVIEIRFGGSTLKARVLKISETARKEEADSMYEVLEETRNA